jgi:predicted dehydrogenase
LIHAGIIGLGRWGRSLVEAVQGKSERLRFIHGVSKEPDAAADFATRHGFRLSTEFEAALADPQVEALFLATPHSLHVPQVIAAARAGKPVWCEKPLALTRAGAAQAIEACRSAGMPLGSGNNKRCFASMRELKRVAEDGSLGTVLHVEGHFSNEHSTRVSGGWRDDPSESPGAGMTGAGLHVLDAFVNLAGPIRRVDARVHVLKPPPDPRDVVAILAEFTSGATGLLATVRAAPMLWRVQVFGTNGWAMALGEDTLVTALMGQQPQTRNLAHVDSLALLVDAFADAVEGRAPFPVSPAQMLDVIAAFEAVIGSISARGPCDVGG